MTVKNKGGRPVEYPDSPMHVYWRELKRREAERKKAEKDSDVTTLQKEARP